MSSDVVNSSNGDGTGPRVAEVLLREIRTGMRQLAGTRIDAAIEVSESVVANALRDVGQLPRAVTVRLAPANRVIVGFSAFQATAVLAPAMDLSGPRIEFELQSQVVAWALRRAIRTPAVTMNGRRVAIDLGRLERAADFAAAWNHVRSVGFATAEGTLFVHVRVAVE